MQKSLCIQLLLQIIGHAACYGASAAHTASLSSGCRNSRFTPELCLQVKERKNTAFYCEAYYSEGDSSDHLVLFMQRDASKWPRSRTDFQQLKVLPGPVEGFHLSFFIFCFLFGLFFLPLASMKRHDVVHLLILLRVSQFFSVLPPICCRGTLVKLLEV